MLLESIVATHKVDNVVVSCFAVISVEQLWILDCRILFLEAALAFELAALCLLLVQNCCRVNVYEEFVVADLHVVWHMNLSVELHAS